MAKRIHGNSLQRIIELRKYTSHSWRSNKLYYCFRDGMVLVLLPVQKENIFQVITLKQRVLIGMNHPSPLVYFTNIK